MSLKKTQPHRVSKTKKYEKKHWLTNDRLAADLQEVSLSLRRFVVAKSRSLMPEL